MSKLSQQREQVWLDLERKRQAKLNSFISSNCPADYGYRCVWTEPRKYQDDVFDDTLWDQFCLKCKRMFQETYEEETGNPWTGYKNDV